MNVLFVCTGNTCRSPMAEVLARAQGRTRGMADLTCASAGTLAFSGRPASGPGVAVAAARGLDLAAHRSRELSLEAIEWADVIVGMEAAHAEAVARWAPCASVHVMTDFLPSDDPDAGGGIPDPYGGDIDVYEATWALLDRALDGFFHWLRDTDSTPAVP